MKITFELLFPTIRPWVEHLDRVWPAYIVKPQFASWEVLHILSLVILGGTSILMNLRLAGVGLKEEPPSEIYRNLRRWQDLGVIGIIVSGGLIGMANAERLYDSTAFVVKMICLAAGVILTYGASRPIARADGAVSRRDMFFLAAGSGLWLVGLWIFATGVLINPGLFHLLTAAALMVALIARGRLRQIFLVGLAAWIATQLYVTHVVVSPDDLARLDPVNKALAGVLAAWILGGAVTQATMSNPEDQTDRWAKMAGYVSILVWVSAAAAGRWIAFA